MILSKRNCALRSLHFLFPLTLTDSFVSPWDYTIITKIRFKVAQDKQAYLGFKAKWDMP